MTAPTDLETRLRRSLVEHARQAPPGHPLADRILAELDAPVLRPRRAWRAWTFPLLAAAAIAAVALAVVGLSNVRLSGNHEKAATQQATPTASVSTPTASPSAPAPSHSVAPVPVTPIAGLPHFQAIDTTYFGTSTVWALGTADCSASVQRPCAALARSDDAGTTWTAIALPGGLTIPLQTCSAGCVRGIRFANPSTGYLFGRSTFEITRDGGRSWQRLAGGADAVETLNGTVIRVARHDPSCLDSCRYDVTYAPVGSPTWTASTIGPTTGYGVQLERADGASYLLVRTTNPGDAAQQGQLYRSGDGGASWQRITGCVGLRAFTAATGTLDLLCGNEILVGAGTPTAHRVAAPGRAGAVEVSAATADTLFVSSDRLWRSTDGGASWTVVVDHVPNSDLGAPGFQDARVGHWLTDGGRTIWTTHDAGATWTEVVFSR